MTSLGTEAVRKWLQSLSSEHKKEIGKDIKTVQFGWPLGMPLAEKIKPSLWEVRSKTPNGIARVLFTIDENTMILLRGFVKKSQKIPKNEMKTTLSRLKEYQENKK